MRQHRPRNRYLFFCFSILILAVVLLNHPEPNPINLSSKDEVMFRWYIYFTHYKNSFRDAGKGFLIFRQLGQLDAIQIGAHDSGWQGIRKMKNRPRTIEWDSRSRSSTNNTRKRQRNNKMCKEKIEKEREIQRR